MRRRIILPPPPPPPPSLSRVRPPDGSTPAPRAGSSPLIAGAGPAGEMDLRRARWRAGEPSEGSDGCENMFAAHVLRREKQITVVSLQEKNSRRHPSVPTPLLPLPFLHVLPAPPSCDPALQLEEPGLHVTLWGRGWNAALRSPVCPRSLSSSASELCVRLTFVLFVNTHISRATKKEARLFIFVGPAATMPTSTHLVKISIHSKSTEILPWPSGWEAHTLMHSEVLHKVTEKPELFLICRFIALKCKDSVFFCFA